jgi:hypothetical protein
MSISGIFSRDPLHTSAAQGAQNKFQQIQTQFQKIGQDLRSGNLTQAQADYITLSQQLPGGQQAGSSTSAGATSSLAKAFQTLGHDLQAGNLAASQADFAAIQQEAQQQSSSNTHGHRHHHHGAVGSSQQTIGTLQQQFTSLGKALQSGNLASAQQAYSTFQTDLQQEFSTSTAPTGSGSSPASSTTRSGAVNVTA